jgi:hypothetical protein
VSRLTANVFGSAAGGGFPQWNCNGEVCRLAWAGDPRVRRGFIHFDLFLICFYFGLGAPRAVGVNHGSGPVTAPSVGRFHEQLTNAPTCVRFGGPDVTT